MSTAEPAYNPPLSATALNAQSFYSTVGAGLLGLNLSAPTTVVTFEDFLIGANLPTGWTNAVGGTGTNTTLAGVAGGWRRCDTGGTAGGVAGFQNGQAGVINDVINNVTTSKWYLATRFKIATAVDAAALMGAGLLNTAGTKTIHPGFFGPINAANFIVQYDGINAGSGLNLGVPVDTSAHVFEVWGTGSTTINGRIDGGATVSATMASAPTDNMAQWITSRNGASNASRQLDIDWTLIITTRT